MIFLVKYQREINLMLLDVDKLPLLQIFFNDDSVVCCCYHCCYTFLSTDYVNKQSNALQ